MRTLISIILFFFTTPAAAAVYVPHGDLIGDVEHYSVKEGDTLYDIARKHDLGIVELLAANPGIDAWIPEPGTRLMLTTAHVLPAKRKGIVINLSELRLFYFTTDGKVLTFPIGIGREGWLTPTGTTVIAQKRKDPIWIPPASIREENPDLPEIVPAGPDNPMGAYALNLGWRRYAIHGTNRPFGVGKRSSHGCIRLYPEDIAILFQAVSVGTPVTIIDSPHKLGWVKNELFLEITPNQVQTDSIAEYRIPPEGDLTPIYDVIREAIYGAKIDWAAVDHALAVRNGIPVKIGTR